MFQLILGISLAAVLLFVILLLISEVGATYRLLEHEEKNLPTRLHNYLFKHGAEPGRVRLLLIVLTCILGLCVTAYFIKNDSSPKEKILSTKTSTVNPEPHAAVKVLTDTVAAHGLFFSLQVKWEDGKMYCINKVGFLEQATWNFSSWRYYLLDKDGYLIKQIDLTLNDFVSITNHDNQVLGLINRCTIDVSLKDYQKISTLRVALDKTVSNE